MVKDKAYTWIVFVMLLLAFVGCSAAETPATVEAQLTPAIVVQNQQTAKTVEVVLPAVVAPDTGSSVAVNVAGATPEAVRIGEASAPGGNVASPVSEPASGAAEPVIGMANPASVYCEEHGGRVDIRTSEVGQYGVCMFSDGQECDEWAFYRGECMLRTPGLVTPGDTSVVVVPPATPLTPVTLTEPALVSDVSVTETEWIGTIVSMPAGGQYDDYFQLMDQAGTRTGIAGRSDEINKRLAELRDTGTTVHVWGVFHKAVPDAYELQIEVSKLEIE